jgi:hypothetical protein
VNVRDERDGQAHGCIIPVRVDNLGLMVAWFWRSVDRLQTLGDDLVGTPGIDLLSR